MKTVTYFRALMNFRTPFLHSETILHISLISKNCSLLQTVTTSPIRGMGEGNSFSLLVYPHPGGGGTYPGQVQTGGGDTPRYLPPARSGQGGGVPQGTYPPARSGWGVPQGTYLPPLAKVRMGRGYPKVSAPPQVRMGGGDTPRYPPPWPGQDREGVPQGTYPPAARTGWGRGTIRYLLPSSQVRMGEGVPQGTYPQPN